MTPDFPFWRGADNKDSCILGLWWVAGDKAVVFAGEKSVFNRITRPLGASYPDSE